MVATTFSYRGRTFVMAGAATDDVIYREIDRKQTFYEVGLLEYADHLLSKRSGLVIDAGANIGNHSTFLGSFGSTHVIAIEPNPAVLPALRANLERNLSAYTLIEKGLGARAGRAHVVESADHPSNYGMAELEPGEGDIELVTLDSIVADWRAESESGDPVTLIKIDVEGMELAVLEGAVETITRDRPHLLIEAATPNHARLLSDRLSPLGYASVGYFAATPVHHFSPSPSLPSRAAALSFKARGVALRKLNALRRLIG